MQIHSTNPLERPNAEIKRRTEVVGILPNEAAITHLAGALLLEQNHELSQRRRYMQLEGLQSLSDNQLARLSKPDGDSRATFTVGSRNYLLELWGRPPLHGGADWAATD